MSAHETPDQNEITLITGFPRSGKTTYALIEALKYGKRIIYVTRTINNINMTLRTINETIKSPIPFVAFYSVAYVCNKFPEQIADEVFDTLKIEHDLICKAPVKDKAGLKKHFLRLRQKSVSMKVDLITEYKLLARKYTTCPYKILLLYKDYLDSLNKPYVLLITYSMYKILIESKKIPLENPVILFDEARYITDYSIIAREFITKHTSIKKKENIDFNKVLRRSYWNCLNYSAKGLIEAYNMKQEIASLFCSYCDTLREYISEIARFTSKRPKRPVFKRGRGIQCELIDLRKRYKKKCDLPNINSMQELIKVADIFCKLNTPINRVDVNVAVTVRNDKEKGEVNEYSISFVIREMTEADEDVENRNYIKWATENCRHLYLVDSTPYPLNYVRFWLGDEYVVKTITLPSDIKFTIITDEQSGSMKLWLKKEEGIKLVERVFDLWIQGKKYGIRFKNFARSKKEKENIELYGKQLLQEEMYSRYKKFLSYEIGKNLDVARGSQTEGIQSDATHTLSIGQPFQNFSSEDYREKTLNKMCGKNKIDYIIVRTLMERLQHSFRTAMVGKNSGSVWLNTKQLIKWQHLDLNVDIVEKMHECWPWTKEISFKKADTGYLMPIGKKSEFILNTLLDTGVNKEDIKLKELKERIYNYIKETPRTVTDIAKNVKGKNDYKQTALRLLCNKGRITFRVEASSRRPRKVYYAF